MDSVFVALCLRLYKIAENSTPVRIILSILKSIKTAFRYSIFGRILCRPKSFDTLAATSVFYRDVGAVWKGSFSFFAKIYNFIRDKNKNSVNSRVYEKYFLTSFVYTNKTPLLLLVMFVIPHDYWQNAYGLAISLILACFYCLRIISGGAKLVHIWFPLVFFIVITFFSVVGSAAFSDSIRVLMFFITGFLLCLTIYGEIDSENKLQKYAGYIFTAVIITSIYAIIQRIIGVEPDAGLTDLSLNSGMPGRVFSTLGNPNNYAEFLMIFIPFGLAFSMGLKKASSKALALWLMLLPAAALLLTYSRSTWIAFAVSSIVFVCLYNGRSLPIFMMLALCAIPLLPNSIIDRILTIGNMRDSSSSYRVDIWTGCLNMLKQGYWIEGIGLGPGAFTTIYPDYAIGKAAVAPHSHLQFLEILIEMGLLGLISFLWYNVSLIRRSAVAAFTDISGNLRLYLCASAFSITGITINGLFEYTWFYPRVMFAYFIAAGFTMAAVKLCKTTL